MTWIAARHRGHDGTTARALDPVGEIRRGTLVAEVEGGASGAGPLLFIRRGTGGAVFSLQRTEDGRLVVLHRDGDRRVALSVGMPEGTVRVLYSWNADAGISLLTAETRTGRRIFQQTGSAPPSMPVLMVTGLLSRRAETSPDLCWWSLHAGWIPAGPGACVTPDAVIETERGDVPAGELLPGDRVMTADAGAQPVIWAGAVAAPALGGLRAVRMLAPFFGRERDLVVHPSQPVLISGQEVEYLLGEQGLLVEARQLVNGGTVCWAEADPGAVWQAVVLPKPHLIRANGCAVLSSHLGGLARAPDIAATTAFAAVAARGDLPVHGALPYRMAAAYEATALSQTMIRRIAPVAA